MKKLVIALLFFHSLTAFAAPARYTLSAPEGWVIDTESGKPQGLHVVLYPKGTTWTNGNVVMYTNTAPKSGTGGETAESVMASDIEAFRKQAPNIKVGELETIVTKEGKKALLREFEGSIGGNFEAVAYVDEPQSVVILALSARNKTEFTRARKAFDKLVASYALLDTGYTEAYANVESEIRRVQFTRADELRKTSIGQRYNARVGQVFGREHRGMIVECIKATGSVDAVALDFVMKVDANGHAGEVHALQNTAMANCLSTRLRATKWPAPPQTPFYSRLSVSLK